MYLDCRVEIPNEPGKISRFKKGKTVYIRYVVSRTYHPDKKYNVPDHKTIGKLDPENPAQMIPNENFLKYFGDVELPEIRNNSERSSCIRIGAFLPILSSPKSLILWTFSLNSYLKNRAKSDEQSLYLVLNSQKWV